MKSININPRFPSIIAATLLAFFICSGTARAATVTNYDSILSLATNVTKNYTFVDPASGLSVVVAVTLTPYSSITNNPVFTLLDFYGPNGDPVHMAINSVNDGNWVDNFEGLNFSASLVSVSGGIPTNSIQFAITGIGIRGAGAELTWTSPDTTNTFTPNTEQLFDLDTNLTALAGTTYAGELRTINDSGLYQLSDSGALANQSIVFNTTFTESPGAGGPAIYVSDIDNLIEEFHTNGFSALFAATGNNPAEMAFDQSGNLYVANTLDGTIEKLTTNGVSSIFASGLAGPASLAFDGAGNLYVGNIFDGTLRRFSSNGTSPALISSDFSSPVGLAFDQTGNLYVSDGEIGLIEKFTTNGASSVFASGLNQPTGLAFDGKGNLYAGIGGDNTIQIFTPDGNSSVFATSNLDYPGGLAFDPDGNLYVCNTGSTNVVEITASGVSSILSSTGLTDPQFVAVWPLPPQLTPASTILFPDLAPVAIASGTLYLTGGSGVVDALSTNGSQSVFASGLGSEQGAAFDSSGNLYVVDQPHNLIEKYTPYGAGTVFATNLNNPIGLAIDTNNNVYVNNYNDSSIDKFTPAGVETVFGHGDGNLQGMAFDGSGNLYVAEYNADQILKFDALGNRSVFANTGLDGPHGLAFDAAGSLYVANNNPNTIEKFTIYGTDLGVVASTGNGPSGLAFDNLGNLYVACNGAVSIQEITPQGLVFTLPYQFAFRPNYLALWSGSVPALIPSFPSFNFGNGQFQLTVSGTTGTNYILQATTNLALSAWISIATNPAPFVFVETNASLFPQRFYRALVAP